MSLSRQHLETENSLSQICSGVVLSFMLRFLDAAFCWQSGEVVIVLSILVEILLKSIPSRFTLNVK